MLSAAKIDIKALFSASVVLFIEKLFLQFIAINFHQKALADRLAENRLGLKALDRLSNAHTPVPTKRVPYTKRGHKPANSSVGFFDLPAESYANSSTPETTPETQPARMGQSIPPQSNKLPKRKKKAMTSVIVDQVCPCSPLIFLCHVPNLKSRLAVLLGKSL